MTSQNFKAAGFYDREIDLTARVQEPVGIPGGVVGVSERGPAFIPTTVGSFADFQTKFGGLNPKLAAPYAVDKFLENKTALTFLRVLGAGANQTSSDFSDTNLKGIVKNAGFFLSASNVRDEGVTQFLVGKHQLKDNEAFGWPMFTNNSSYLSGTTDSVYLIRGMIFAADGSKVFVMDHDANGSAYGNEAGPSDDNGTFKVVISSSAGDSFSNADGVSGLKIVTASFDPSSDNYFAKVLNTDPAKFAEEKHYVYADFSVDSAVAVLTGSAGSVAILSGSANTSATSGDTGMYFRETFGSFNTRYTAPKTPKFISQPYGNNEYDLFRLESLDDGAYANNKYKISISNIQKSSNPKNEYGTFSVMVRVFNDSDVEPKIIEQFNNLSLNPEDANYIAKVIGDKKATYVFDVEDVNDRRIHVAGKYPNKSKYVRVVMEEAVEKKLVPASVLPFGFRGHEILKTNPNFADSVIDDSGDFRLAASGSLTESRLLGAIVPPTPFRFKITRGDISTTGTLIGEPGNLEIADSRYYWGVMFNKINSVTNPNTAVQISPMVESLVKFAGIEKLDALVTGSSMDRMNDNKFTLARVAFANTAISDITSSVGAHMREAAYIRNGVPDSADYTITDNGVDRVTFASLIQKGTNASDFNQFTPYAKFTTFMYGGWDGTNILDKNAVVLNDRATSKDNRGSVYGGAHASYVSPGFASNQTGAGLNNASIAAYRTAADIMANEFNTNVNVLVVPGQREPFVTDYVADKVRDYGLALYQMDVPKYNSDNDRIFDGDKNQYIDVDNTINNFDNRAIDNEFVAPYAPDFIIEDDTNNRRVTVPATVGALAAVGFNDKVAYPWFAPAGFNRGALAFVKRSEVRLKQSDRERMEQARINPIVKFPNENAHVIFAQTTLKGEETALRSINVLRMIVDVKRQIIDIGNKIIFENLTDELRAENVKNIQNALSTVQARSGIEKYKVISDNTNNTVEDKNNNKMNVRIIIVPTRSIEQIHLDYIITKSGASFV